MATLVRNNRPPLPAFDARNMGLPNTVIARNGTVESGVGADGAHLFGAELMRRPSFQHHVQHVLAVGAEGEVQRVDAARRIAFVQHVHLCREWAYKYLVGGAVRPLGIAADRRAPVTSALYETQPHPAPRWRHLDRLKKLHDRRPIRPRAVSGDVRRPAVLCARLGAEFTPPKSDLLLSRVKGFLAMLTGACYGWFSHTRNSSFLCWSDPLAHDQCASGSFRLQYSTSQAIGGCV